MKLDPEEQIIAAALDQAELDDANERGVAARIEFRSEGHAKVTFTISREFVETARALDWTTGELVAEAIGIAIPDLVAAGCGQATAVRALPTELQAHSPANSGERLRVPTKPGQSHAHL
jgi:hypothetical protein